MPENHMARVSEQGWITLIGVPAFFYLSFILAHHPRLLDLPLCSVKLFLGIACPGCGILHSLAALAGGDINKSIHYHPLGVVVAAWTALVFIRTFIDVTIGRPLRPLLSRKGKDIIVGAFLTALFGQWLVKLFFI